MQGIRYTILAIGLLLGHCSLAQVTGGQYSFEFLRMSNSPHVSALGGMSIANPDNDISLALQNPAMMRPGLHNQLGLYYNGYYGGIGITNLQYGYHMPGIATSFVMGVQYLNYGTFSQTDDLGNVYGDFRASDYVVSLGASRAYGQHWRYGAALKYAHSFLYQYGAAAVVMDIGVNYYDTSTLWDFGITAKNMGATVETYIDGTAAEPLPFDLQLGISKRFKHMPLRIFTTVHHLYEWDIRYDNPNDITTTTILGGADTNAKTKTYFSDKLFRHFIFGGELTLGGKLVLTASYNNLRRRELAIKSKPGPAGFAFGVGVNLKKFQIHYARSYYHIAGPYNEIGINVLMNKLVHMGKADERMKWNNEYPDWE